MKLYYSAGSCSMAVHIALRMAGLDFKLEKVNLAAKKTESGEDFLKINPKGYVPTLQLDNGEIITEVAVILQYIADHSKDLEMIPKANTLARYHFLELLNFVSTEIHKSVGGMFNPDATADYKEIQLKLINKRFNTLSTLLNDKKYLDGKKFTVADAYLFTVLGWTRVLNIDLGKWPTILNYFKNIAVQPIITETMAAEGLGK